MCDLAYGPNSEGRCHWCGEARPGRRYRWCSDECQAAAVCQHVWTHARAAALRRDVYTCVRCVGWPHLPRPAQLDYGIDRGAYLIALAAWERERADRRLEVNHIVPRRGAGYGSGCHHHLANLETLCHRHHVEETNHQRRTLVTVSGERVTVEQLELVS